MSAPDLADPAWLAHRLDWSCRMVEFVRLDRAERRAATFLDDNYLAKDTPRARMPLPALHPAGPIHFIFHGAFASSTLLCRLLDAAGGVTALQEPTILNDLAQVPGGPPPDVTAAVAALLARPFAKGEAVVAKASNAANPAAAALLAADPGARAILLQAPLRRFLGSVARRGLFGRIWARRLLHALRVGLNDDCGIGQHEAYELTDLQAAAAAWLMHQAHFRQLERDFPGRVLCLTAGSVSAMPATIVRAAFDHFRLRRDDAAIARAITGPVMREDSKRRGTVFARTDQDGLGAAVDEEIDQVAQWLRAVAGAVHPDVRGLELQ